MIHSLRKGVIPIMNEYQILLKEWLDALLDLQIGGTGTICLDGAIMCPACKSEHGRSGDMVYALVYMYSLTKEEKYLEASDRLLEWTEKNFRLPSGGYKNGAKSEWTGITVFAAISYGLTLAEHKDELGKERFERWSVVFFRLCSFMDGYFETSMPNINYAMSYTALLAIRFRLTGDMSTKIKAREWFDFCMKWITPEGLIYGEGIPMDGVTAKGCRSIDIGYNVEESLPSLVLYSMITGDEEAKDRLCGILRTHLEFMIPDGGWDNSFGSRFYKWTYWGSRTSDGCQSAYILLSDRDPMFGEAAYRNYLLYKRCTVGGLLAGGLMYRQAGEPPCVHHTFCHVKAMTVMSKSGYVHDRTVMLPRETGEGMKHWPSLDVTTARKNGWVMTVSGYDFLQHRELYPTGGALTLLWNSTCGPVISATPTKYKMVESGNMQTPYYPPVCGTPSLEKECGGKKYSSLNDTEAVLESRCESGDIVITARGIMKDAEGVPLEGSGYEIEYRISDDVSVSISCKSGARFTFPVISASDDTITAGEDSCIISGGRNLKITCSVSGSLCIEDKMRGFNPVGGFQTLPLSFEISDAVPLKITVSQ
ncbi:MAG: hypothetical protein J5933_00495 [Clostridia bacterium]|nr:hypothetical protein [Clostridia bacterium]